MLLLATVTQLRVPTALWAAMKALAAARGLSANQYVLRAIRAQMARDARTQGIQLTKD